MDEALTSSSNCSSALGKTDFQIISTTISILPETKKGLGNALRYFVSFLVALCWSLKWTLIPVDPFQLRICYDGLIFNLRYSKNKRS